MNLDLNGQALTGNVAITSATVGILNISAGTITGNLTVDAKNATVNNSATVTGTITIKDVAIGTWNQKADANKIVVNVVTAAKTITVNIDAGKTVSALTLETPVVLTVPADVTIAAPVVINAAATVISPKAVSAVIKEDVVVTVKAEKDAPEENKITGEAGDQPIVIAPPAPAITLTNAKTGTVVATIADDIVTVVVPADKAFKAVGTVEIAFGVPVKLVTAKDAEVTALVNDKLKAKTPTYDKTKAYTTFTLDVGSSFAAVAEKGTTVEIVVADEFGNEKTFTVTLEVKYPTVAELEGRIDTLLNGIYAFELKRTKLEDVFGPLNVTDAFFITIGNEAFDITYDEVGDSWMCDNLQSDALEDATAVDTVQAAVVKKK